MFNRSGKFGAVLLTRDVTIRKFDTAIIERYQLESTDGWNCMTGTVWLVNAFFVAWKYKLITEDYSQK